jgi:hypothetical protein
MEAVRTYRNRWKLELAEKGGTKKKIVRTFGN